jgi:glycosyltransferase involved in cell wall biosynthesis
MRAETINRQWSVNGRFLGRNVTGVDRYAWEILRAIDTLICESHPLTAGLKMDILCPAGAIEASPFKNIPLKLLPSAPGHLWEQFILPRYVRGGLLSMCNTGPLIVKRQLVCIHDMNTRIAPESYGIIFRIAYRFLQPSLGRRAARIVTVSHFSKQTMMRFGIVPVDEIAVIHDGCEHVLQWKADRSPLCGADIPRPFVMLVGSKAPHKNTDIIYLIADELAAMGIYVLMVGGADANIYARQNASKRANVRHLGRVNDDDLAFLYRHALCLVFPSTTEGFGMPALEAMALGCPVISSDAASMPEVCGDAALYASPHNPAAWLAAIVRIATEPILRRELADAGPKRSKAFSWQAGAKEYLGLMLDLDSVSQHSPHTQV